METYKLTDRFEIRELLEQSVRAYDAIHYCSRLAFFFEQKVEAIIELFTDIKCYGEDSSIIEEKRNALYKKYRIFDCDAYDLEDAFNNMRIASRHRQNLSAIIQRIEDAEVKNPTSVEVEALDYKDDYANARIELGSTYYSKYAANIMPPIVLKLYERSYGIGKFFEEELGEFLTLYNLK